jgi:hypothetical protein
VCSSYLFEIRKTFTTKAEAIAWEHRVLTRLDVVNNSQWLNENVGGKRFVTRDKLTEEHKRNVAKAQLGKKRKPHSEETKAKISASRQGQPTHNKGKPMSEEQKKLLSQVRTGYKSSEETKAKIGAASKGRIKSEAAKSKISIALKKSWDERKRALSGS